MTAKKQNANRKTSFVQAGVKIDHARKVTWAWIKGHGRWVAWTMLAAGVSYALATGGCSGRGEFYFGPKPRAAEVAGR